MMRWFGPAPFSQMCDDVPHAATPIGLPCLWCADQFVADDLGYFFSGVDGQPIHVECFFRMTMGSLAHQQRACTCYGGDEEDPPGLSKREAARYAYRAWLPKPQ